MGARDLHLVVVTQRPKEPHGSEGRWHFGPLEYGEANEFADTFRGSDRYPFNLPGVEVSVYGLFEVTVEPPKTRFSWES